MEDDNHNEGAHGAGQNVPAIPLPMSPTEINAYVAAVMAQPEAGAHMDDASKSGEHAALLDLVPRSGATHVAVRSGDWFDPNTWHEGRIPADGARALIPEGVQVAYDGQSDADLFTLRVDGELTFASDRDTRMVIDTFVVSPTGRLEIGSVDNPVQANVQTEIIIADNGDIDTSWDPMLLSRGVISHGAVEIHGAEKDSFLKVAAAPMAGDTTIQLAEAPEGWQVGDTIVLTGTHKLGWTWDHQARELVFRGTEDEEVEITAINGDVITIDRPLTYDHDAPRDEFSAYVSNMSRNVVIASENGADAATHHRGHVMFMHSDDVDVRYAEFDELGRTDKSFRAVDAETLTSPAADENVKGRYSFHFHRTGTEDQENPAIAIGNAVTGSPGWGFVHHSSHANFVDNVAFDVFGAAFVAEAGDETGSWLRNLAIKAEGIGFGDYTAKDQFDVAADDVGRTGDGFFFASRSVETAENIAANTTHGFVWMTRGADGRPLPEGLDQPEILYGLESANTANVPIHGFQDNEALGTHIGLIVVKNNPAQGHDVRTVLDGFTAWEVTEGVNFSYTAHYTLKDFVLVGTRDQEAVSRADTGVVFGNNAFDFVINGIEVEGFEYGIDLDSVPTTFNSDDFDNVIIDPTFVNVAQDYLGFNAARHTVMSSADLTPGVLSFDMQGGTNLDIRGTLFFDGVKTDSIGSRDRQFDGDRQHAEFYNQIRLLLQEEGYYRTADGAKVVLVDDYIADRATGELAKLVHVVTLELTDQQLIQIGAIDNGPITLGGPAPVTADDALTTREGVSAEINVIANDTDPDGGALRVDGLVHPRHGEVHLAEDGATLRYVPDHKYTGSDSFGYWAKDEEGNVSYATVSVTVAASDGAPVTPDDPEPPVDPGVIPMLGDAQDNFMKGSVGDDWMDGGAGDDTLRGEAGDDEVYGGAGRDIVRGGAGDDRLYGQDGDDIVVSGDRGDDLVYGEGGDDVLRGGADNDYVDGGAGADRVIGDRGDDTLLGGAGDDVVIGHFGDDFLIGGDGFDRLIGGDGADTFRAEGSQGVEVIADFQSGVDQIDLSFYDVNAFDQLNMREAKAGGVVIDLSDVGGETIIVRNVEIDDLTANDFII